MTDIEYAKRRLHLLEATVRNLMAMTMEQSSPYMAGQLDRLGREWDKALDELDATFAEPESTPVQPKESTKEAD